MTVATGVTGAIAATVTTEAIAETVTRDHGDANRKQTGRLFAAATVGVVRSVLRGWFDANAEPDVMQLAEEAFLLLETGFAGKL